LTHSEAAIDTITEALKEAVRLIFSFDPVLIEITARSLRVTLVALAISVVLGIPAGTALALARFPGRRIVTALVYTGMGFPPVVVGLVVYLLLSRNGPLGEWQWLFTMRAMIFAQVILATPVIVGITMSSVLAIDPALRLQLRALGATRWQTICAILIEARFGVIMGIIGGFGAAISEVGAVMLVGGNIEGQTRVLTTAIVLETRQGRFALALALGIILLALSFVTNLLMMMGQGKFSESA
jgi:tungstate transport system permease protein